MDDDTQADDSGNLVQDALGSPTEAVIAERREELERIVLGSRFNTLEEKVAWVLNRYSDARDSDLILQARYWDSFENMAGRNSILRSELFNLSPLTSLSRARATIQNKYKLFLASDDVRKRRGVLSDEERDRVRKKQPPSELLSVYADESGKQGNRLIVGSVWVLDPIEDLKFYRAYNAWREERPNFKGELHFKDINRSCLSDYLDFADFIHDRSSVLSFKVVSVERAGLGDTDKALARLHALQLRMGVHHENKTGRAKLPRRLNFVRDKERQGGADDLMLAELRQTMEGAADNEFGGELLLGSFNAVDSSLNVFVQVADLFAGSIGRISNPTPGEPGPKDQFAARFLNRLGLPNGPTHESREGDLAVRFSI